MTCWIVSKPSIAGTEIRSTGPFADLVCNYSVEAFCSSLAYNCILVLACAYWAFKTRHLPDNFNESKFILFCVYSQMILWLIFIPAYFAVKDLQYEVVFLCLILIINSSLILSSLYVPKLYAVYFVNKEDMRLNRGFHFTNTSGGPARFLQALDAARGAPSTTEKSTAPSDCEPSDVSDMPPVMVMPMQRSPRSRKIVPLEK